MKIKYIQNFIDNINKNFPDFLPVLKHDYIPPISTYNKLICVTGFLYSGSGALIDLLKEFNNVTVLAYSDIESGEKNKNGTE